MAYSERMRAHLGEYKVARLGVKEAGKWRDREYAHILPPDRKMLNILAPLQQEFAAYRASHPKLKLHRDFAHLNSSQAACINLFMPLFNKAPESKYPDGNPLPFEPAKVELYEFEHIPDKVEGTNFDFWIRTMGYRQVFCEFKLTEGDFGKARDDTEHRQKLEHIYRPMLAGKVSPDILEPGNFFARYQLLRNIAYADRSGTASVLFVVPRANERLAQPLAEMRDWLAPDMRPFVSILHIEDIVSWLRSGPVSRRTAYYDEYAAKYLPSDDSSSFS